MARFQRVMLFVRDVASTVNFYEKGLGMRLKSMCETGSSALLLAEEQSLELALQQVEQEAFLCTGYGPLLCFEVKEVNESLPVLLQLGAVLDGPVRYPPNFGEIATLRSPQGHMLCISSGPGLQQKE